jgi:hypothetical protein
MKTIEARLQKLEQENSNTPPLFLVRFEDETTQRMDIVHYAMLRLDNEAGLPTPHIVGSRLIRGDTRPFSKLCELIGGDW